MNLIANRHLDGAQKKVIYELTLKKRQSKKSTMSERQRAARQQLAKELMLERKIQPASLGSISSQNTIDSLAISGASTADDSIASHTDQQSFLLDELLAGDGERHSVAATGVTCQQRQQQICCCCGKRATTTTTNNPSSHQAQHILAQQHLHNNQATESSPTVADSSRLSCASCSFTRSDSSYSGSSASVTTVDSSTCSAAVADTTAASRQQNPHLMIESDDATNINPVVDPLRETRKKEATIRVHKLKLEHLNYELERRLHQYEYLVAQEKALLGTYNMVLFTNQGVNNFHLHRDI